MQNNEKKQQHFELLKEIKDQIGLSNKDLKFYIINGDKNDLDKHYHQHMPMLFLVQKGFRIKAFNGKFMKENILRFMSDNIKNLKIPIDDNL